MLNGKNRCKCNPDIEANIPGLGSVEIDRCGRVLVDGEREGLEEKYSTFLGVGIPQVEVPLFPGKNITVISEVIAMNHMFKVYGVNAAERFNRMLIDQMESDRKTRHSLRYDTE